MNKALQVIPTIYFMLLAMFWLAENYMSLGIINYIAFAVLLLLLVQSYYNQKHLGLLYGSVLAGFSVYKLVEAFVVHAETINLTDGSFRFLIIKSVIFGVGLLLAILYSWYYTKILKKDNTTTTSV
jgi:hypothetical protein